MSDGVMTQEELDALLAEHTSQETSSDLDINAHLTAVEQDALAEIGNISMGSAATALSTLVNRKVRITVTKVYLSTPAKITESYPVPCIVVNVGYIVGLEGVNLLVIHEHDALVIGNLMMGEDGTNLPAELDELYLSAVTEAMNMMMGSASTAMSELFGHILSAKTDFVVSVAAMDRFSSLGKAIVPLIGAVPFPPRLRADYLQRFNAYLSDSRCGMVKIVDSGLANLAVLCSGELCLVYTLDDTFSRERIHIFRSARLAGLLHSELGGAVITDFSMDLWNAYQEGLADIHPGPGAAT